jgi:hypothetical protein
LEPTSETYSVVLTRVRPNGLSKSTLVPASPEEKVPNFEYVGGPPPPTRIESCSEPGATRYTTKRAASATYNAPSSSNTSAVGVVSDEFVSVLLTTPSVATVPSAATVRMSPLSLSATYSRPAASAARPIG